MDLTRGYPRSPQERLDGIIWIPRAIDKARAHLAGTAGGYMFNCPMDARLFQFLGLEDQAFLDIVRGAGDDAAVMAGIRQTGFDRSPEAIAEFNNMLSSLAPSTPANQQRFRETVEKLAPGRADITTWVQLLDLEEGRLGSPGPAVPAAARPAATPRRKPAPKRRKARKPAKKSRKPRRVVRRKRTPARKARGRGRKR